MNRQQRRRRVRLRKRRLYRCALYEKEQLSEHTRFRGGTRRHHLRCLHLRRVPGPQRTSGALQQPVHNGRNRLCAGDRPLWPPVVRHEHGKVRGHAGRPCAGHAGRGAVLRRRQRDKLPDLGPREQHLSGHQRLGAGEGRVQRSEVGRHGLYSADLRGDGCGQPQPDRRYRRGRYTGLGPAGLCMGHRRRHAAGSPYGHEHRRGELRRSGQRGQRLAGLLQRGADPLQPRLLCLAQPRGGSDGHGYQCRDRGGRTVLCRREPGTAGL